MKPVAWYRDEDGIRMYYDKQYFDDAKPLYSAQREWVGLTEDDIEEAINANCGTGLWSMAKDIEDKLKEKNT